MVIFLHDWFDIGDDTPFQKLLSQLSSEMIKTSNEQQDMIKQQIETEKLELKKQWEQLQSKIEEEQSEREKFKQVSFSTDIIYSYSAQTERAWWTWS